MHLTLMRVVVDYDGHVGILGHHVVHTRLSAIHQCQHGKLRKLVLLHLLEFDAKQVDECLVLLMSYLPMV